jgi:hypothetical protein
LDAKASTVVALFIRWSLGRPCAGPPSVTLPRRKLATLAGDRLTIRAGRADLTGWQGPLFAAVLGHLTATTVGAVLASRRPGHPVGLLLLGFALSLTASGVIATMWPTDHWPDPAPCGGFRW